jgi:Domain of unknown function (DUF4386)
MNTFSSSANDKRNAAITGLFFILAAVSSIIGKKLYDPVLTDANFLIAAGQNYNQLIAGAINELILAASATGTGIMLYPYLKRYSISLGMGYLSFRLLEVVFILIGIVSVLTVLSISLQLNSNPEEQSAAHSIGSAFIALHNWTFILGPNFMLAINTFLYSYVFHKTGLVPRYLSKLGVTASCLIMLAALLELFGIIQQISLWGILLALPIAAYEMWLAVFLIAKGFRLNT